MKGTAMALLTSNEATTKEGGACYIDKSATFTDCKFDGNKAASNGGALLVNNTVTITGTTGSDMAIFTNNNANKGGAIYIAKNKKLTVNGYSFSNNTPENIYNNSGTLSGDSVNN